MYPPTIATVTYLVSLPDTTATAVLNIPAGSTFSDFVQTIMIRGFWLVQNMSTAQPSSQVFIPAGQILNITCS